MEQSNDEKEQITNEAEQRELNDKAEFEKLYQADVEDYDDIEVDF